MTRYIRFRSELVEIPAKLMITELRPKAVRRILKAVVEAMKGDVDTPAIVDVIRLKDTSVFRIVTKRSGGLIYWLVQDWFGRENWAGGFFQSGRVENMEEAAVALPAMRGRGLYMAVLKHIRKAYKKPLVSDRTLSLANIRSWIRAGASIRNERFRINPKPWLHQFVSIETITL